MTDQEFDGRVERPKIRAYQPGDVRRYAHVKRDGIWLTLHKRHDGQLRVWTRHPTEVTDQLLDHETVQRFDRRTDAGTTLYCECWVPGHPASAVKNRLAEGKMKDLVIECFAIGGDHGTLNPSLSLETIAHLAGYPGYGVPLVPFFTIGDGPSEVERAIHSVERGEVPNCEGLVLKNGNLLDWCKWKLELTVDCVVTAVQAGRGKYTGMVGALHVSVLDETGEYVEVARVSGMTDDERQDMTDRGEDDLLGEVCEVRYQYVGAGGRLRHPRFVMWRDDKVAEECTVSQVRRPEAVQDDDA